MSTTSTHSLDSNASSPIPSSTLASSYKTSKSHTSTASSSSGASSSSKSTHKAPPPTHGTKSRPSIPDFFDKFQRAIHIGQKTQESRLAAREVDWRGCNKSLLGRCSTTRPSDPGVGRTERKRRRRTTSEDENEGNGHDRNQFEVSGSRSRGGSVGWDEREEKDDGEESD